MTSNIGSELLCAQIGDNEHSIDDASDSKTISFSAYAWRRAQQRNNNILSVASGQQQLTFQLLESEQIDVRSALLCFAHRSAAARTTSTMPATPRQSRPAPGGILRATEHTQQHPGKEQLTRWLLGRKTIAPAEAVLNISTVRHSVLNIPTMHICACFAGYARMSTTAVRYWSRCMIHQEAEQ
jgi:hypothetical protein